MGMQVGDTGDLNSEINVTPLVDVCLVLLIIFMVITPMLQVGIGVPIPVTQNPEKHPHDENNDSTPENIPEETKRKGYPFRNLSNNIERKEQKEGLKVSLYVPPDAFHAHLRDMFNADHNQSQPARGHEIPRRLLNGWNRKTENAEARQGDNADHVHSPDIQEKRPDVRQKLPSSSSPEGLLAKSIEGIHDKFHGHLYLAGFHPDISSEKIEQQY